MESLGEKAQAAKDKTYQAAQTAQEKTKGATQSTSHKTQEKAGVAKDKAWESKEATKDKASEAAQRAGDTAESGKEKNEGFLQQTGAQVKNMTQGAVDTVKSTLGMAKDDEENDEPVDYKRDRN